MGEWHRSPICMPRNGKHPSAREFIADLAARNEGISRVHSRISGFPGWRALSLRRACAAPAPRLRRACAAGTLTRARADARPR